MCVLTVSVLFLSRFLFQFGTLLFIFHFQQTKIRFCLPSVIYRLYTRHNIYQRAHPNCSVCVCLFRLTECIWLGNYQNKKKSRKIRQSDHYYYNWNEMKKWLKIVLFCFFSFVWGTFIPICQSCIRNLISSFFFLFQFNSLSCCSFFFRNSFLIWKG